MARVNFPTTLLKQYELALKVKAKHDADGATSPLIPYLTEQGIDATADETAANMAAQAHLDFGQHEKDAEEDSQKRDRLFEPVFNDHRECVQFLKKLFRNNEQKLGEWGVTVNNHKRVVYPADFLGRRLAVQLFRTKHLSYTPPTSPLQPFLDENEIDLDDNDAAATKALNAHESFEDHNTLKEELRVTRDNLFDPVVDHVRGIGEFLVGLYPNNPNKAGKWGFVIDNSPQADHIRAFKLSSGEIKTVKNVKLKTKVKNTGPIQILIRPGNEPQATPVPLDPSKEFTVVRGYGKMLVENASNSSNGSFEATINE